MKLTPEQIEAMRLKMKTKSTTIDGITVTWNEVEKDSPMQHGDICIDKDGNVFVYDENKT